MHSVTGWSAAEGVAHRAETPRWVVPDRARHDMGDVLLRYPEPFGERFGRPVAVELGMRYGNPSLAGALQRLADRGVTRLLVLPLYPQYSATTTASSFDRLNQLIAPWRRMPSLHLIDEYHLDAGYIKALASSISEVWQQQPRGDRLLFSFHGIPLRYHNAGDPYPIQCQATAAAVAAELGLQADDWALSYQSRLGREEWLRPYTDETLAAWPAEGVRRVDVVCPGFSADCLETLEEIAGENRETFLEAGGEAFHYIPALNVREDHIAALSELIVRHAAPWC